MNKVRKVFLVISALRIFSNLAYSSEMAFDKRSL